MFDVPAALAALRAGDTSAAIALRDHFAYLIESAPAVKQGAYFLALSDCIRRLAANRQVPGDAVENFIEAELWRTDKDFGREKSHNIAAPASTKSSRRAKIKDRLRRAIESSGESLPDIANGACVPVSAVTLFHEEGRGLSAELARRLADHLGIALADNWEGKLRRRRHNADHAHDENEEYVEKRGHLNSIPAHKVTVTDEGGEEYVPSRLVTNDVPPDDLRETICRTPEELAVFKALEDGHRGRRDIARATGLTDSIVRAIMTRFRERATNYRGG